MIRTNNLGFTPGNALRCLMVCAFGLLCVVIVPAINPQSTQAAPPVKKKPGKNFNSGECNAYLSRLSGRLENNWLMPDGRNVVTITAILNQDGSTGDVSVTSSPGTKEAESAANEAFVKTQPFEALPASAGATAKLIVVFDSNADPHGDTSSSVKASLGPAPGQAPQGAPAN